MPRLLWSAAAKEDLPSYMLNSYMLQLISMMHLMTWAVVRESLCYDRCVCWSVGCRKALLLLFGSHKNGSSVNESSHSRKNDFFLSENACAA